MKKSKLLVVVIIFSCISFYNSHAQYANVKSGFDKDNSLQFLSTKVLSGNISGNKKFVTKTADYDTTKEKNPFLGGVLSAIIPGAGEFYAKSYIKSAIFLAIEAGLWVTYATFQKKGNDQTTAYQQYADQHWSVRKYAAWLVSQNFTGSSGINPNEQDLNTLRAQVNSCEEQSGFSHTLPKYGDQQYYEVIGKYRTYTCGWDQAGPDITKNNYEYYPELPQISNYMSDRQNANNYYDKGTTTLTVVILNHIASTVDGVLSVHSYNNKLSAQGNISFAPVYSFKEGRSVITSYFNLKIGF
jgi:hypothetical protein